MPQPMPVPSVTLATPRRPLPSPTRYSAEAAARVLRDVYGHIERIWPIEIGQSCFDICLNLHTHVPMPRCVQTAVGADLWRTTSGIRDDRVRWDNFEKQTPTGQNDVDVNLLWSSP